MTDAAPAAGPSGLAVGRLVRITLLGALVGVPVGLLAFAFIWLVHQLEHLLWHDLPAALGQGSPPWYLLIGLPVLGALGVHFARTLPGDGGHSPIHDGVGLGGHPNEALGVGLAAGASLAFGAVLGPEAPLLALGGALAVWLTSRVRLDPAGRGLVGAAGSAAALSTLFGGPLVSGLMLLESGAGAGLAIVPIMLPALAASSVAYLLITGLGTWSGLPIAGLVIGDLPTYNAVVPSDLPAAVVVGVVMAVLALGMRRLAGAVSGLEGRVGRLPLLVGSGLAIGLLAWGAGLAGANPLDVLFSGQASITPLLEASGGTLVALALAKALAYVVSLGGGFRGGAIFPAVFIGVAVADVGVFAFGMSPTVAIAIGTAAGTAAMTRLLVSSVLFAGLLVGRAGLETIPVATIAAVAAWLASAGLDRWLAGRAAVPAGELPA
ncbi:MAG TPA: chloride channel protein [Propionicimonas sp.]|uniref:chloride channel protein n=1 Tax=Propionicimonas sp. TaxID=1955623 RepID=UPI002F429F62